MHDDGGGIKFEADVTLVRVLGLHEPTSGYSKRYDYFVLRLLMRACRAEAILCVALTWITEFFAFYNTTLFGPSKNGNKL